MTQAMSNVEKMLNAPFKGGSLRTYLGEELCDRIGVYNGMRLDLNTLRIMLDKANDRQPIDFSSILLITRVTQGQYVDCLDAVPNVKFNVESDPLPHYYSIRPTRLYEWTEYDDSVRNLYRAIAPLIFKQQGVVLSETAKCRIEETLRFVCPVFWFEYNFVTKRFSMRTSTGITIRRLKRSQYPFFSKEPMMSITIADHEHYALLSHTNKSIHVGDWLDPSANNAAVQLHDSMVKYMSSAGWNVRVRVFTNKALMKGHIEQWAIDLRDSYLSDKPAAVGKSEGREQAGLED